MYYKPLNERKNLRDWHFKMNFNERIECIAQGSGWCAAATSNGFLRIFSSEGVQKQILHQSCQIVTMAGYENLLAIFYHSGLPVYESQQIKFKIIDCGGFCTKQQNLYKTVLEGEAPT